MFKKKKYHAPEDSDLLRLYRDKGEKEALGILFERYMHLVYGVCRKYLDEEDSKDAVMQIFEKLLDKVKQHEISNFPAWLHILSKNHCLMWHRKEKSTKEAKNNYLLLMESEHYLHHDNGDGQEEKWDQLQLGLNSLSHEQQQCVKLFYLEKKCYNEIVEITGYELKKVKSYIQNGKRNLKIFLQNKNEGSIEK